MPDEYDNNVIKIDFANRRFDDKGEKVPQNPPAGLPEDIKELINAAQEAAVALDMIAWEEGSPGAGDRAQRLWNAIEDVERNTPDA